MHVTFDGDVIDFLCCGKSFFFFFLRMTSSVNSDFVLENSTVHMWAHRALTLRVLSWTKMKTLSASAAMTRK